MSHPKLTAIKLTHTVVWAFFVLCIVGIPIASMRGAHGWALGLSAIVMVEVAILAINRWRCPLTAVAARYTDQRQDNFDIYLPLWLARHNKWIFGPLYVAAVLYALWRAI